MFTSVNHSILIKNKEVHEAEVELRTSIYNFMKDTLKNHPSYEYIRYEKRK